MRIQAMFLRFFREVFPSCVVVVATLLSGSPAQAQEIKTENVLLITFDGLRFQELFGGADERLMNTASGGVDDLPGLRQRFRRETAEERREILLPFLWGTVVEKGRLFGDADAGSPATVTNRHVFSYPGYSELLTGYADDERIKSNRKLPNENVTVLEWLHEKPAFRGKVEAFGSWDVFPYIINTERSGIPVNAGWMPIEGNDPIVPILNRTAEELPKVWKSVRYDIFTYEAARIAIVERKPRVIYIAFGESDDWAHKGRYDLYLDSSQRADEYVRRLWVLLQSMPQYKDKTSLVITTDHGRGDHREDWLSHSATIEGANRIWSAVMGPDTPKNGIARNTPTTQSQTAATVAALLGLDYPKDQPKAAAPLPGITR